MKCDGCDRIVKRIHARESGHGYCGSCYKKLFKRYSCEGCGSGVRLIKADTKIICSSCKVRNRKCGGCDKPLPRASKTIDGAAYCWPCSKKRKSLENCERCKSPAKSLSKAPKFGVFERVCDRCRRQAGHATCPNCGKNRELVAISAVTGQQVCKQCINQPVFVCPECHQQGRRHSKSQCEMCYRTKLTEKKQEEGIQKLHKTWAIQVYQEFGQWLVRTRKAHTASVKLTRHLPVLIKLEAAFNEPGVITPRALVELFGLDGMRRHSLIFDYLQESKSVPAYSDETLQRLAQIKQADEIVQKSKSKWFYNTLYDFNYELLRLMEITIDRSYRPISGRTVLALVRAASEFLRFIDDKGRFRLISQISQNDVDDFSYNYPGYRSSINKFITYLNERESLNESLSRIYSPTSIKPSHLIDIESLNALANMLCNHATSSRDGCIGILMMAFAQRASEISLMLIDQVKVKNGEVTIILRDVHLTVPDMYGDVFMRWLKARQKIGNNANTKWLFPGRQFNRPLSQATIISSINKYGVTAKQLRASAVFMMFVNGNKHPNVPSVAFGVSKAMSGFYYNLYNGYVHEIETNMTPYN